MEGGLVSHPVLLSGILHLDKILISWERLTQKELEGNFPFTGGYIWWLETLMKKECKKKICGLQ